MAAAPTALYSVAAPYVAAEQFLASKTSMAICKLNSVTTAWNTQSGQPQVTGSMQSLTNPQYGYMANDTDWVVVGPTVEVVYPDAQFHSLFSAVAGNFITIVAGPGGDSDSMSATGFVYANGAGGSVDIDWGDGNPHDTGNVTPAAPLAISHVYAISNSYLVVAALSGGNSVSVRFEAMYNPPADNTDDLATMVAPPSDSGDDGGTDPMSDMSGPGPRIDDFINAAYYGQPGGVIDSGDQLPTGDFIVLSGEYTDEEMAAVHAGAPPPQPVLAVMEAQDADVLDPAADQPSPDQPPPDETSG